MAQLWQYITPTVLYAVFTVFLLLVFLAYYWCAACPLPRKGTLEWINLRQTRERERATRRLSFADGPHPMRRPDVLLVLAITAVYACTAFYSLGSFTNPQSYARLDGGQTAEISLGSTVQISKVRYYPWLGTGSYTLEGSADGVNWFPLESMDQSYTTLYKWMDLALEDAPEAAFLRVTAQADKDWLELGEIALYGADGARIPLSGQGPLTDEQDLVPERLSWYNSTYFDEIYHARTAQEHIQGVYPYEITHPPLGKLILGLGVRLFGMTPFGWRFMGTLFGVLMLPLLYAFLKNLFGKTQVAAAGAILLAADFMHLTQTRIATIDTYGVFFILGMYYFLYRWLALPAGSSFKQGAPWLLLSGLFWGLGAASKWTVIYGAVGLALLYFVGLGLKLRDWPREGAPASGPWVVKTILFSVLCFVVIPLAIYCAAYIPYAMARGDLSPGCVWKAMWDNQVYMLGYHKGVNQPHPYSSRWYQWIVDGRPILYYVDTLGDSRASIAAFSNPVVCWGGLLALISTAVQLFRRRSAKALFIVVGYFSQLAPWLFITRTTFEYHYFPSILFLIMALCFLFNDLLDWEPVRGRRPVWLFTGGAAALYAAFYPVLTGLYVPVWYSRNVLQWFLSWPI